MTAINSFFTNAYSTQYASQLFTKSSALNTSSSLSNTQSAYNSQGEFDGYSSTSQRALARITEIITGLGESADGTDTPQVEETAGHITSASGTSEGDELTFKSSSLFNVDTGGGDDTVTVKSGSISNIDAGDGNDTLNMTADTAMDVAGGEGDDTINFTGNFVKGVEGGEGDDTLRISAQTIMDILGGAGNDTIIAEGERIALSGGTGDDTITITNTGERAASYDFALGDGSDTIKTDGALNVRFTFGYVASDLEIAAEGNKLSVSGLNGDKIEITLAEGQDAADYTLGVTDGVLTLAVGSNT